MPYRVTRGKGLFGSIATDSLTVNGNTIAGGLELGESEVVDLNGEADALILDADGDTTISAPTDDQIDVELSGADDFRFTANTFTALSGSTIATNTIAETTAGSGVTIDGVLIKDGAVQALDFFATVGASGAVAVPAVSKTFIITKSSAGAAMTIVDPTATTHDGVRLTFISATAQAHSLDNSAGSGFNGAGAGGDVATFDGNIGSGITIVAYQGTWYILASTGITLA